MKVLFVSFEVSPFAKVGGLADVAGSLPKALRTAGVDIRVAMPAFRMVEAITRAPVSAAFEVAINPEWTRAAYLRETTLPNSDVPVYLVGTDDYFNHTIESSQVYQPGVDQHLFFSTAVLEMCKALQWKPDIIHTNDWHLGLVPLILREKVEKEWDSVASVHTIHNFAYQGEFGAEVLDQLGLPSVLFNLHKTEAYGRLNFLKTGCAMADMVTTVSPRYAQEIQTPQYGERLEGLMSFLASQGRLAGILNGLDTEVFSPERDPDIPANFSVHDLAGKETCKRELQRELGLPQSDVPLFGVVSRLSRQKGLDLLCDGWPQIQGAQLVVQGLGDQDLVDQLRALSTSPNVAFVERFDAPLAQRVYAGCDAFVMPSRFEPCGLGQLIAMQYGTVPVVRATGGLADTVSSENGFVFEELTTKGLCNALETAIAAFGTEQWIKIQRAGMTANHGWSAHVPSYLSAYKAAIDFRK